MAILKWKALFDSLELVIITMQNAGPAKLKHHEMPAVLIYIIYSMKSTAFPSLDADGIKLEKMNLPYLSEVLDQNGTEAAGNHSKAC